MAVKRILLIRHGKTGGNLERRYSHDPEEPLCAEGVREALALARSGALPAAGALYSGRAARCRQTAALLFPSLHCEPCPMREIDFGVFKGKNANELLDDTAYGQWLETGCMGDIPGGDSVSAFKERCREDFSRIARESAAEVTALVLHGGNIMSILEGLAIPRQDFYSYHVPNCGFFLCRYDGGSLVIDRRWP